MQTTQLLSYDIEYDVTEIRIDSYEVVVGKDITGADMVKTVSEKPTGKAKKITTTTYEVKVKIGTDENGDLFATTVIQDKKQAEEVARSLVAQAVPSIGQQLQAQREEEAKAEQERIQAEREARAQQAKKAKEQENEIILAYQSLMRYFQDNEDEKYGKTLEQYKAEYDKQNGEQGDTQIGIILAKALEMTGVLPGYTAGNGKIILENIQAAKKHYQEHATRLF